QRVVLAVIEVEVARGHLGRRLRQHRMRVPGGAHGYGKIVHFAVLSAPRMRAPMFRASTVSVIKSAPLQASCFQKVSALCTKLLMVTGRLAIVLPRLRLKNWLDSAVKSSGAVSPATRAVASSTPVIRPLRAAR